MTIDAGDTSAAIDVSVIDDSLVELAETVTLTLDSITSGDADIAIDGASDSATVTIADDDSALVSIAASDPNAAEPGDDGQFTVSLTNAASTDTVVSYTISGTGLDGTDYTALSGTVTIDAGDTSATIDVPVIDDSLVEASETVTLTLDSVISGDADIAIDGAGDSATVTIADDDTALVSIAANDSSASEPSDHGQFTVSLSNSASTDTVISYTISGTAAGGADYTALSGTVTINAGDSSATIDVTVTDDLLSESLETVTLTLDSVTAGDPDIAIDSGAATATVTITDDDSALVSIAANDASAAEPGDDGQFTVTLSTPAGSDTVISYTVSGTAAEGVDFALLTGTVTITGGDTSATIDISVIDDPLLELSETVSLSLDAVVSGEPGISIDGNNDSATVTIADDDSALLSITANDPNAAEPGDDGQFTVSLSNAASTDTVVSYTITGTALGGTDFGTLSGTVTIDAGDTSATIDVSVIDDSLVEASETVTLTLDSITSGDADIAIDGAADSATVTIADDDSALVSIAASDSSSAEPGDDGQFTVSLSNAASTDTVVSYTITGTALGGTDFGTLSGTVTIDAGDTAATIDVSVIDDSLVELSETVTLTLGSITSGDPDIGIDGTSDSATVTIADDDSALVSIAASDPIAGEPGDDGQFTVSLTNASSTDTVVSYTISGTGLDGTDYAALSGTVTIDAGDTAATIDVSVIDDSLVELAETVTLTLDSITSGDADIAIDGAADSATVTIADDDSALVSIAASDPSAAEPGDDGQFTVSLTSAASTDTVVSYTISGTGLDGTDYATLSGTVTIDAGDTAATIDVSVIDDSLVELSETVTLTLDSITSGDADIAIDGAADSATVTIADDDSALVSIAANDASAAEPGDGGQFTVSLTSAASTDTIVSYTISGTALGGTDYTPLSGTVTIDAGDTAATIDVSVIDDSLVELSETVTLTLDSITSGDADIAIDGAGDSATVTIADDDSALVSIAASDPNAAEPGDGGQFTVSLTSAASTDTVVSYTISGTGLDGTDYAALSGTVTIDAGDTAATIDVSVIDDSLVELAETVTLTLDSITSGDADIAIDGAGDSATVTIADDDSAPGLDRGQRSRRRRTRRRRAVHRQPDQRRQHRHRGQLHDFRHGDRWNGLRRAQQYGDHRRRRHRGHHRCLGDRRLARRAVRDGHADPRQHHLRRRRHRHRRRRRLGHRHDWR